MPKELIELLDKFRLRKEYLEVITRSFTNFPEKEKEEILEGLREKWNKLFKLSRYRKKHRVNDKLHKIIKSIN